jgi:hypothetical protein
MAETIVPVVHGDRRGKYWITVALHTLAAAIAAATLGALLGAVGMAIGAPWGPAGLVAVAVAAALYAGRAAFGLPVPIPDRHRQVPDWWRSFFSAPTAAVLYGAGLGVGFLTFLTFGTFVAVAVAALASGDPLLGAALCAPFGLARGLSVTVSHRARSAEEATCIVERLEGGARRPLARVANAAVLVVLALAAALAVLL